MLNTFAFYMLLPLLDRVTQAAVPMGALAAVSHPRPCGTGKGTLPEGEGRISQFPGDPSCWPPPVYRPDCYPAMQPIRVKTA